AVHERRWRDRHARVSPHLPLSIALSVSPPSSLHSTVCLTPFPISTALSVSPPSSLHSTVCLPTFPSSQSCGERKVVRQTVLWRDRQCCGDGEGGETDS